MLNKPFTEYSQPEQDRIFSTVDELCESVMAAHEELRSAEARYRYALTRHISIFASTNRIPRHFKKNLICELEFIGAISHVDASRLSKLKDAEVVAELRASVKLYKELAAKFDEHTQLIAAHPIVAIVTKEKCRIDSDTIIVFQDLIEEHLTGFYTHGWGSQSKPSWQECYNWIAMRKDKDGRPMYCRSVGSPAWTSCAIKRYFQAWCRHFGFTPKEITAENRPDIKAVNYMRGLPSVVMPCDLIKASIRNSKF